MSKKCIAACSVILTVFIIQITAQYPDTLWMPITFYDYQTDPHAHNPDFEACLGAHAGMIHDTLSSLGKPLLLKDYGCNDHVEEWYWPSGIGQAATYNFVTHRYDDGVVARPFPNEYVGIGYDSTYEMSNIVIYDTLEFVHLGNGLYEFKDDNFFPIDGRGYGEESRTHNYGFAMELHTTFRHKSGLTFYFQGDDDAWAFIDGHLEMDLGGIHQNQAAVGSFSVDTLGLTPGQEYDFDFFYAERHTKSSQIWITTNLISTHIVTEITIEAIPPVSVIPAGDSVTYRGTVWYDSTDAQGTVHHIPDTILSEFITWSHVSDNPLTDPNNTSLAPTIGSQTIFTSTQAYETFTITASYEDPVTGEITTASAIVTVIAGPPDHLVIEASADTSSLEKKQNDQPLDTLVIAANVSSNSAYAILRDQWGNFSNYSQHTAWQILSGTVLASATVGTAAIGEGVITKHGPSGIGTISAGDLDSVGVSYVDTCVVKVLNEAPVANNDLYTTLEDVTLVVPSPGKPSVLQNDVDPDPNAVLTAELVTDVTTGVLNFNADGSFTYVPPLNFSGTVQFTYKAYDGEFYSNVAIVTIIVGVDNDPPIANNDAYATNEDVPLTVAAPGVLTNDNDIDGDPLTAQLVSTVDPLTGTLTLNADGSFTYVPAANFNGTTTFRYQANDGTVNSNVATVTITVNPVNDAPVAQNDNYVVNEDNTLTVGAPGILSNDSDIDGDPLSAALVTDVTNGTLVLNANGSFTYTPDANFNGTDTFTYRASDGTANSNIATVTITVVPVNDLPVAVNDVYTTSEDVTLNVAAPGVLTNDIDVDGNPLSAVLVTSINPAHGTLTLNADGSFTYVPTPDFNGTAIFTYRATDGTGNSGNATVMIFVTPVNDAPVANNDFYATDMNVTLNIAAPGVLANDNDIDGDALVAELVTGITLVEGTLTLNADGSFTYVPTNGYTGTFTFTYKAQDDTLYSNVATVTIVVGSTNRAPVAFNDSFTTPEKVTLTIPAIGVLSNDSDPDADPLFAILISGIQAAQGTLTFNADGSFTYVPNGTFNGIVTFTYQASDGALTSNVATVTITVTPANDIPVANNDAYATDEDIPLQVPGNGMQGILANDVDADGDPLTAVLVTSVVPASGTLTLSANGSFVYVPTLNFNGTATFTYKATDGTDTSAAATVTITVNPVNDAPVIADIPNQTIFQGNTFQTFDLDSYITDVDNTADQITWSATAGVKLSITIDPATHVVTVTILDASWIGSETITFTATDPGNLSASDPATFTVLINARLPMPETDTVPGVHVGNSLTMNLYVPNFANADILYTTTTDGTIPPDPKTGTPQTIHGTGLVSFGPFATDSTPVKVLAYSKQAPYESSENRLFEYLIVYPQLPDPVATPDAGQYDTTGITVTLTVPGHPDAVIYYTLDGTDPATSPTRILYNTTGPIVLGPYAQVTYETISVYATETFYKPSAATFDYVFNPSGLLKPVADPPGHTFHTDSIQVILYVPGEPDAEIRFTTDGTMPNVNSDLYTGPITINGNTTLKAIAVNDDNIAGPVMTEIYIQSLPTALKLFPDTVTTTPYPATTTCTAGELFPLIAKIFDQYDTCLTQYLTADAPIDWTIQEITGTNTGTLTTDTGYSTGFLPVKAHNTVKITATFSENGKVFSGEITLIINPGMPYKLWLEADYDRHVSPNAPNPVDTIRLSTNKTFEEVYAVIRDSLGNWAGAAKNTDWVPAINTIATVASGRPDLGEGIITMGSDNGTVIVAGTDMTCNLMYPADSTVVVVMTYWYDSLRIVVNNSIAYPVDSLIMNTNQDSILYVFGHRDDGATPAWEEVSAKWELVDKSLEYIIASPPASAHRYTLSPVDTATGRIRVTLDDDAVVAPDTVWVHFTPGGPMRVEFELLTPDSLCIAGDTLTTVVRLYNGDNKLVYGTWTFPGDGDSVQYDDIIGKANRPDPFFLVDGSLYILNDQGTFAAETFLNGLDTVDFVLYYAPYDEDSLHQLTVTLDYTLTASTRPFRLLAGALEDIDIVVDNTTPDTVIMYYNSGKIFKVIGYDTWGNIISVVICNWSTTGTIPAILFPDSTKQIYYSVGNITYNTSGYIIAASIIDSTITDSVLLIIGPRPAALVTAVTRDLTGNGYLDAVTYYFDKKIILPANTLNDDLLTLRHIISGDTIEIYIDSLVQSCDSLGADSVFTAYFEEYDSGDEPQTDWLPYTSLTGFADITAVTNQRCVDGAPPVVWKVLKISNSSGNHENDKIYVTLSESFVNTDGSPFMYAGIKPAAVLNIWNKTDQGFVLERNMLLGIQNFANKERDTLLFYMTNGNNITTSHYCNLVFQDSLLADVAYNTPAANNQKVRVQVIGTIDKIVVGPNPIIPTLIYYNTNRDQPLIHEDPNIVYNRITTHGGSMIVVDIELSTEELIAGNVRVTGQLMIFDATGNLVYAKENRNNLLPDTWQLPNFDENEESGTIQLVFYWDGVNDRGMKAAPGVYRTIMYVKFGRDMRKIKGILAVGR